MMDDLQDDRNTNFYWVNNEFFDDGWGRLLGPYGTSIYHTLVRHTNGKHTDKVWPSYERLADLNDMSTRQAKREVKRLILHNLISVEKRPGQCNLYVFNDIKKWVKSPQPVTHSHPTSDTQSPPPVTHSHPTRDTQSPEQYKRTKQTEQNKLNNHHHAPAAKNGNGAIKNCGDDDFLLNRILALHPEMNELGARSVLKQQGNKPDFPAYLAEVETAVADGRLAGLNAGGLIEQLRGMAKIPAPAGPKRNPTAINPSDDERARLAARMVEVVL